MFTRRNHSRRNKQSFNTCGAEVLEERRMPTILLPDILPAASPGNGGGLHVQGDDAGGGIFNNGGTVNVTGSDSGGSNILMGDGSVRFITENINF